MRRVEDQLRVRVERGVRWVRDQYRTQGARGLVNKARSVAAQLLEPPPGTASRPVPAPGSAVRIYREDGSPDVLAGMCAGVALRDLNLVDSLLAQLEDMEANEGDPEALARLYQLDHLAARLRRNAENLRVLAGQDAGGAAGAATPLVDLVRAAMSSIEQYPRIEIGRVVALAVVAFAADDLGRLLAELLDNATSHSPPASTVTVSAHLTEQGSVLLRIEDAGIGLPEERLRALNARLVAAPKLDSESIEHMGLAVVRRLAAKHGIRVTLGPRATHGTTATVLVPANLVSEVPAGSWSAGTAARTAPRVTAPAPARGPAAPPPSPRPAAEWTAPEQAPAATGATTRNGLPRRVPQSLRDVAVATSAPPGSAEESGPGSGAEREQLMADLGDFSDGEQAARELRDDHPRPETEPKDHTT